MYYQEKPWNITTFSSILWGSLSILLDFPRVFSIDWTKLLREVSLAVTYGPQNRIIIKETENINLLPAKYYHCNRKYEGENKGIMGE